MYRSGLQPSDDMSAVELRLSQSALPREMGAMRVWLDQHRFEPSSFSCRDVDDGVVVSLEFKIASQAHAFAERFGGRADGPTPDAALDAVVLAPNVIR
jgi:hypothetical protein